MAKKKTFTLKADKTRPWFYTARYPFHKELKDTLKQYPGVQWDPSRKTWLIPQELQETAITTAESFGFAIEVVQPTFTARAVNDETLHDYQHDGVRYALAYDPPRHIFGDEMGLGKTAQAIRALEAMDANKVLIVCPAVVRSNWVSELDKWWENHYEVGIINANPNRTSLSKKERKRLTEAYHANIQIISYNLLEHVKCEIYEAIIFDEIHRLQSPSTSWSEVARHIVLNNPKAAVFGLTGTIMPNQPTNAWNPVHTIWPDRMGKMQKNGNGCYSFKQRYTNPVHNGYGWDYSGVNTVHAEELNNRLSSMITRTTKVDVAHLLPPFTVTYLSVEPKSKTNYSAFLEKGDFRSHKEKISSALMMAGNEKIPHVMEWLEGAVEEASHVCIMTHLRATAKEIADKAQKFNVPVYCITGALTPEKRNEVLAEAKDREGAIVVATMHSVGIGIDLTFCTVALFAELYYRPETVVQALGRFSRLSGTVPSSVTVLSLSGTLDELIADKLRIKIEAINAAIKAGDSESRLEEVLTSSETEEEFLLSLTSAADSMVEDPYN